MSYHIYETHPQNKREIAILVDDDLVIAKYESDDDVFFIANSEECDIREELIAEFGEEFTDRVLIS